LSAAAVVLPLPLVEKEESAQACRTATAREELPAISVKRWTIFQMTTVLVASSLLVEVVFDFFAGFLWEELKNEEERKEARARWMR
jgi:hypothetical protein